MATWNDGGVPFGCRTVRFYSVSNSLDANGSSQWSSAKGIYILESFTVDRPQYEVNRYSEARVPNGGIGVDDYATGSAVVQLQYGTTTHISNGDAFTTLLPSSPGGVAETFVVKNASDPESQGDIRKQSITLRKLVAATTLPTAYP